MTFIKNQTKQQQALDHIIKTLRANAWLVESITDGKNNLPFNGLDECIRVATSIKFGMLTLGRVLSSADAPVHSLTYRLDGEVEDVLHDRSNLDGDTDGFGDLCDRISGCLKFCEWEDEVSTNVN